MSLTNHAESARDAGKLKYLVYTSIASPDLTEEGVQSMLATAREHNASAEITGLLRSGPVPSSSSSKAPPRRLIS